MLDTIGETFLSTAGKIGDLVRSGKANSLSEFTAAAHVLPVFLLDNGVSVMPEAEDIIGGTLNLWAANYLMAAQLSVNIGEINVIRQLERLNNRRDPINAGTGMLETFLRMESYENGLPDPSKPILPNLKFESKDSELPEGSTSSTAKGVVERLETNSKLSIGKTIEVNWESKGQSGTIVTSIRPMIRTATDDSMVRILTIGTKNVSFKERIHGIRSGELHWFYDGVLANDIINDMRKGRLSDNTGYLNDAIATRRKNRISGFLSLNPSVGNFATAFFITEETARDMEVRSNINLDNFTDRQNMFANSLGMILVVVNKSWKNCKIYLHGIQDHTKVSFSQLDGVSKGKGGDIKEMFNALMMSDSPRF